jgi:hypothetical protein
MLPKPEHCPACLGQGSFDNRVSLLVAAEFRKPILAIAAWFTAMLGAPMPETTVNEDGKALWAKSKIGAADKRLVAPPASYSIGTQNGSQLLLSVFVAARSDSGHDQRALFLCEYVRHFLALIESNEAIFSEESLCLRSLGQEIHALQRLQQHLSERK